ncbi:hypothetical protein BABINDRAFT_41271 [Babjeviella inositovora NRRL Y-12698]|uniref:Transcriptional regulatory protein n=1 Tax=Babjeviella inositovora NRRL Y-12698 TaxID=984486 RepID=A0A1E3QIN7_9ASCO|nr:uncharacterized protein BABINDRAFT_41271 [Babjeviella inositovora NRRL Y-12698]ODQ77583.1 hypothetical protein BABINDRAFT_41271 [Babjeviella inositovora NRRL Y-12698]
MFRPTLFRNQCITFSISQASFHTSPAVFSGHSKWATIKHDKAKNDAARQAVANRLARQISVCVKQHGMEQNPQLSALLDKARASNVPKKIVESAIARGNGQGATSDVPSESTLYEGIGAGGVAFIVEAYTPNKARCVAMVKHAFSKYNGSFSPTLYIFDRKGYVDFEMGDKSFDEIFEAAIELGADDVQELPLNTESTERDSNGLLLPPQSMAEIITPFTEVNQVANLLKEQGFKVKDAGTGYFPKEDMVIEDVTEDHQEVNRKIMAALGEIEDVTEVHTSYKEQI